MITITIPVLPFPLAGILSASPVLLVGWAGIRTATVTALMSWRGSPTAEIPARGWLAGAVALADFDGDLAAHYLLPIQTFNCLFGIGFILVLDEGIPPGDFGFPVSVMMRSGLKDDKTILEIAVLLADILQLIFRTPFIQIANVQAGIYCKIMKEITLTCIFAPRFRWGWPSSFPVVGFWFKWSWYIIVCWTCAIDQMSWMIVNDSFLFSLLTFLL